MSSYNINGPVASQGVAHVPPIATVRDATADQSSKTFTVPDDEQWRLNWAHVVFVSNATVGNRRIVMDVLNASDAVLIDMGASAVQAASVTRHYQFLQGIYRETDFIQGELEVPMPQDLWLTAGMKLRFRDEAEIAPAGDDMTVTFQYERYTVGA